MKFVKQNKENPQRLNNTCTDTHAHRSSKPRPTTQHTQFKILLTPGVLKWNRLHLIGSPGTVWLWLVDELSDLLQYWLIECSKKWSALGTFDIFDQGTNTDPKWWKLDFQWPLFFGIYQKSIFPIHYTRW